MCKFKHPNIIKLYGVVSHMDLAYIVMELAPHGQVYTMQHTCNMHVTCMQANDVHKSACDKHGRGSVCNMH